MAQTFAAARSALHGRTEGFAAVAEHCGPFALVDGVKTSS